MTPVWKRWRIVVPVLAAVVLAGAAGGYAYHRHVEASKRVRAASCLRQIALAALMYGSQEAAASTQPAADEAAWSLLRAGGQVVVMRHAATTPGKGDPDNFRLGDRSTQRNLSDAGRGQAKRIGEEFRRRGVGLERVLASQYYRCLDTAQLAFARAEEEPALNSAVEDKEQRAKQTEAARKLIVTPSRGANRVLVTHSVNIRELTGQSVEMGEMLILTPGTSPDDGFRVAGRLSVK
jgi:phosphohistidine phosphatase SixA